MTTRNTSVHDVMQGIGGVLIYLLISIRDGKNGPQNSYKAQGDLNVLLI